MRLMKPARIPPIQSAAVSDDACFGGDCGGGTGRFFIRQKEDQCNVGASLRISSIWVTASLVGSASVAMQSSKVPQVITRQR